MMNFPRFSPVLLALSISACGGGGGDASPSVSVSNSDSSQDIQTSSGANGTPLGTSSTPSIPTFTVSWVAPAQRGDGRPISLSEIAGYKIYTGTTPALYTQNVAVNGSDATSKTFANFTPGSYFISITTLDTEGRESQFSNEIEIIVTN